MEEKNGTDWLSEIVKEAKTRGASDIHLIPGQRVTFRVGGELVCGTEEVTPANMEPLMDALISERKRKELLECGEIESACSLEPYGRLRVNLFKQRGTFAAALRLLPLDIPTTDMLRIPQQFLALLEKKRGLILIAGDAGSGKTTTLASLTDMLAGKDKRTILTLDNPIEYLYTQSSSLVIQREIGRDSKSYATAIKAARHQDVEVITVGALDDREAVSNAVMAAENGRLVLAAVHASGAGAALERLLDYFPEAQQQPVRTQLAKVLLGVAAQQQIPGQSGERVVAFEVLTATEAIRGMVRENRLQQIPAAIAAGGAAGMRSLDDAIYELYMKSIITSETAIEYATDAAGMRQKVQLF